MIENVENSQNISKLVKKFKTTRKNRTSVCKSRPVSTELLNCNCSVIHWIQKNFVLVLRNSSVIPLSEYALDELLPE